MLIVFIVVGLLLIISAIVVFAIFGDDDWTFGYMMFSGIVGTVLFIGGLIAIICCGTQVVKLKYIEADITYTQECNDVYEAKMTYAVEKYYENLGEIYDNLSVDATERYFVVYPDLTDTYKLTETEIAEYKENKEEIKKLKRETIYGGVYRWWVYFGR